MCRTLVQYHNGPLMYVHTNEMFQNREGRKEGGRKEGGREGGRLASFPGRFGREKRPGNFREFKLFMDVTSRQLHTSFSQ